MSIPEISRERTSAPASWYPDPYLPHLVRWWSGEGWTEHTAPAPTARSAVPSGAVTPLVAVPRPDEAADATQRAAAPSTTPRAPAPAGPGALTAATPAAPHARPALPTPTPTDLGTRRSRRAATAAPTGPAPAAGAPVTTRFESVARSRFSRDAGATSLLEDPSVPRPYDWSAETSREREAPTPVHRRTFVAPTPPPLPRPLPSSTASAWTLAVSPWLGLAGVALALIAWSATGAVWVVALGAALPWVATVLLAIDDRRRLVARGHRRVASAAWSLLTPAGYLIARAVVLRGRGAQLTGTTGGLAPAVVFAVNLVLATALVAGAVLLAPAAVAALVPVL